MSKFEIESLSEYKNSSYVLAGSPISSKSPLDGQSLFFNSTSNQWVPSNASTQQAGTNTYYGNNAGLSVTTGVSNVGIGLNALRNATNTSFNVAVGADSLANANFSGSGNVAIGTRALNAYNDSAATLTGNVAIGYRTLNKLLTGQRNTGIGPESLNDLTSGSDNIAIGFFVGSNYPTGNENILMGREFGNGGDASVMKLGNSFSGATENTIIRGIRSYAVPAGTTLQIDSDDRIGVVPSSERYKDDIIDAKDYNDIVDRLKVVNFVYKEDPNSLKQVGLIAEQVFQVEPELVVLDDDENLPFTVNYIALVPILLQQVQHLKQQNQSDLILINELKQQVENLLV
jgi:hypothetical protein